MAHTPKKHIDYTFNLKLNKEDREMLNELQLTGINASEEFRKHIHTMHKNKVANE